MLAGRAKQDQVLIEGLEQRADPFLESSESNLSVLSALPGLPGLPEEPQAPLENNRIHEPPFDDDEDYMPRPPNTLKKALPRRRTITRRNR